MTKIAFMFPGQGSFEPGMGREIAEAEPVAMAVFDEGSAASGLDLRRLCFAGTDEEPLYPETSFAVAPTVPIFFSALASSGVRSWIPMPIQPRST